MCRKHIQNFIIGATAILMPSLLLSQGNLPEIAKKVKPSVVVVLTYDNNSNVLNQGSGFIISHEGDVITNRHVLEGAFRAEIKTHNGCTYSIRQVVAEDTDADIVRLTVDPPQPKLPPLTISDTFPSEGDSIVVIGSPFGLEQTISNGIISAIRDMPGYGRVIQFTAPISSGSSGSPVLNNEGEVVGIATFLLREGQNLNFAIPLERIAKLQPGRGTDLLEWGASKKGSAEAYLDDSFADGLILLLEGENEKALEFFKAMLKEDARNPLTSFFIGFCLRLLGRHNDAVEAYKFAIGIKPDYDAAYNDLGTAYKEMGLFQKAEEAFTKALSINPKNAKAYNNLGILCLHLGRLNEAIGAFEQAILTGPYMFEPYYNLGSLYSQLKRWADANQALKRAVQLDPTNAIIYCNLGVTYMNLKQLNHAIEAHKKAILLDPNYVLAYTNLGRSYIGIKRYKEAIEPLKQAVQLEPDNAQTHLMLGLCYVQMRNYKAARAEHKILLKLDPDSAELLSKVIH